MLLDSTMSADYAICPARFHMRHRKGWALIGNGASIPAIFGSAWGKALDQVWTEMCFPGHASEAVAIANGIAAFRAYWGAAELPEDPTGLSEDAVEAHKFYWPKTAEEMLVGYLTKNAGTLKQWTLLGVEQAFVVPLDTEQKLPNYGGLPDKVIKTSEGHIIPVDHKSTSKYAKAGGFRLDWQEQWTMNGQIRGYAYELSLVHNQPIPYGIIDASLVHKIERGIHKMILVSTTPPNINDWLESEQELARQVEERGKSGIWPRYGIQSGACNGLNGHFSCQFNGVCQASYPLDSTQPPPGFEIRPWTPIMELAIPAKVE